MVTGAQASAEAQVFHSEAAVVLLTLALEAVVEVDHTDQLASVVLLDGLAEELVLH